MSKKLKVYKEMFPVTSKHLERWLTTLVNAKMKNKIKMRYYNIPNIMTKILECDNTKYWQGYRAIRTFTYCWCECNLVKQC